MNVSSGCIPVFTGCVTQCGLLIYCEKFGVLSGRMRFRIFEIRTPTSDHGTKSQAYKKMKATNMEVEQHQILSTNIKMDARKETKNMVKLHN